MLPPNSAQVVRLVNGTFDVSEYSIARDRMADVSIVAHGAVMKPAAADWYDDDRSSYLKYRTGGSGTYVLGVSTRPRIITMTGDDFARYLKHDGILDELARFEKVARPKSVRERYSKHVRAIVQIGDVRTRDYAAKLGYPIEIIFEQNRYDLKFGRELGFQVLYQGKPLVNQLVYAS